MDRTSSLGKDLVSDGGPTPDPLALAIARDVEALHASHPGAPLLEIFDEVMKDRSGRRIKFGDMLCAYGSAEEFTRLMMEAFAPDPTGTKFDGEDSEFRDFIAAGQFCLRYELNGALRQGSWAEAYADQAVRIGLFADRGLALAHGLELWTDGEWQWKPAAVADWQSKAGRQAPLPA